MWLLPGNGCEVGGEGVNVGGLSACTCTAKSTAGPGTSLRDEVNEALDALNKYFGSSRPEQMDTAISRRNLPACSTSDGPLLSRLLRG